MGFDPAKLAKLQQQKTAARTGGKGKHLRLGMVNGGDVVMTHTGG
jgi:hypothetical protein